MSDQKPKIDLKARLGKKPASSPLAGGAPLPGGSSIPPPMGSGPMGAAAPVGPSAAPAQARPSMPRASAPPQTAGIPAPSIGSGIPAPQFGGAARPAPSNVSNPYGGFEPGVAPAVAPARPQAIRIEMGEEVAEAQRRGRKKVAVLALVTAFIGGGIGFAFGGGAERAKGAEAAVAGAGELIKDIEKANAEVQKLADTLKAAKEKIGKGQFPEAEVSQLGAINIPFDGKNLNGKGIGRFKPEIITLLIEYATAVSEANDQKEKLQNVLSGAKKGILELLAEKEKPQVRWSVLMGNGPGGPWASMQVVPAPFPAKDKWPDDLKLGSGKDQVTLKRYTSGNPVSDPPMYIPVDPSSQTSVCPSDVIFKLRRELNDLETVLRGDNTPGQDRPGLIDSARVLTEKLKIIGRES